MRQAAHSFSQLWWRAVGRRGTSSSIHRNSSNPTTMASETERHDCENCRLAEMERQDRRKEELQNNFICPLVVTVFVFFTPCAIIALLLVPITFKNDSPPVYSPRDRPVTDDSLAKRMYVEQAYSYSLSVPDVNDEIDDQQLTDLWFLPNGTRISTLMRSIGRCRISKHRSSVPCPMCLRSDESLPADESPADRLDRLCNRITPSGWAVAAMVLAVVQCVVLFFSCNVLREIDPDDYDSRIEKRLNSSICEVMYSSIIFNVAVWIVFLIVGLVDRPSRMIQTGLSYRLRGETVEKAYYPNEPAVWIAIDALVGFIVFVRIVEFALVWKIERESRKVDGKATVPSKKETSNHQEIV